MKVELADIIDAIEMTDQYSEYFLDKETGEIVSIIEFAMDRSDIEETSNQLDEHGFYRLPTSYEIHDYKIMEDFIYGLPDEYQNKLRRLIRGRGAFRRFKDAAIELGIEQKWYDYKASAYRRKAIEWCEENEIEYFETDATIRYISSHIETVWINPRLLPFNMVDALCQLVVSDADIKDAEERLQRFAPFIERTFPETKETHGLIESPLVQISKMQKKLEVEYHSKIPGKLFLKMDSHLAIAGSIKARGGIYEVLKHAEDLALSAGKLRLCDSYEKLSDMKDFFNQYTIQVGSTGNLGLSIGIMSAALGFKVKVHMSADARQWKKDLLRSKGVEVIEYASDYSKAVAEGRKLSDSDPNSYFIDDEKSVNLFLGYAVAANRIVSQFEEAGIKVDEQHPLIVYIPAGVGGAPGGVTYGLKRIFGDNVHCFFTEPVNCPSVLLGIATQKFEKANVHDFGLSGETEADGLACASPSGFVTRIMTNLLSGEFTLQDDRLYDYLRLLDKMEGIRIEPSSCAAFIGPCTLLRNENSKKYCEEHGLTEEKLSEATQIVWATGGSLVPDEIWDEYLGKKL